MPDAVGRYRLAERLAGGACDEVYKAFDPMIERHLVLTTFNLGGLDPAAADRVRQSFFGDVQKVGLLAHPGIATLFDAGEIPGGVFLATEFVDGMTLADHLEIGMSLSFDERVSIVMQLADALEYARAQGVPHLHVKPTNVLVGADFTPKIRGFGAAALLAALDPASVADGGQGTSGRADVRALAVIAGQLLTDIPAERSEAFRTVIDEARAEEDSVSYATALDFKYALLLALGVDEFDIRTSWEATREATTVQLADTSSLAGLPHSAVQGDLTVLREPTHISPSGVEEMTKLQPAQRVPAGDDPPEPA